MSFWHRITFLGDSVMLLPAALVIALCLIASGNRRLAMLWCVLFATGLFIVAASKIVFIGWGIGIQSLDFTGFSGHAMRAMAVLPVVPFVLLQRASRTTQANAMLVAILLALLICLSRVVIGAHSWSEVIAGAALGLLASGGFVQAGRNRMMPVRHRWLIVLSLLGLLGSSHAEPAPTHRWVTAVALYLSGHDKPFERSDWNTRTCRQEELPRHFAATT